jgi:hypothetical protein
MAEEKQILYSKRYSVEQEIAELEGKEHTQTEAEQAEAKAKFQEFLRMVREESIYIVRPERIAGIGPLIHLAKQLSETFEIDMDIIQGSAQITINIYFFCAAFPKEFLAAFSELLRQCDMLSVFMPKQNDDAVLFSLDYQTHDHYVSGKKVSL